MNEKILNIIMMIVIATAAFFILRQCNGGGAEQKAPQLNPTVLLPVPPAGVDEAVVEGVLPPTTGPATGVMPATTTAPASVPAATGAATGVSTTTAASGPVVASAPAAAGVPVRRIVLGSSDKAHSNYKLAVTINTWTAGVDQVELNFADYAETPARLKPLVFMKAEAGAVKPFAVLGWKVSGLVTRDVADPDHPGLTKKDPTVEIPALSYVWTVKDAEIVRDSAGIITSVTERAVQAGDMQGKTIALEFVRTYTVKPNSYDVDITTKVINKTDLELKVALDQMGSVNLPSDSYQFDSRYVQTAQFIPLAGSPGQGHVVGEAMHLANLDVLKESFKGTGTKYLGPLNGTEPRNIWVAQGNRFFAAVVRPLPAVDESIVVVPDPGDPGKSVAHFELEGVTGRIPDANWIATADALPILLATKPLESPVGVRLLGADVTVEPGRTMDLPLRAYMGPKKAELLDGVRVSAATLLDENYVKSHEEYAKIIKYSQGGPCGALTFAPIVIGIMWLLDVFHTLVGNWGVAILLLTLFVRLLLHPLTRISQTQMAMMQKKMAAIKPELDRVKKKYEKADKKVAQVETMKVYKENNVNPAGGLMGCLPMLLQTPIWLALFGGLATTIALRHAAFIPGWINDLSNPDTVYRIATSFHVPFFGIVVDGHEYVPVNVLPLVLGVLYFINMKVMSANQPAAVDAQQAQTQKISQYMILLFPIFLYHSPSGLNLYMVASSTGGMLDTWLIRRSLKAKGILPAAGAMSPM